MLANCIVDHYHARDLAVQRIARDMRGADIDHLQQLGVNIRLALPDIEHNSSQLLGSHCGLQSAGVNHPAARGIDKHTSGLERSEEILVGQVIGFVLSLEG